MNSRVAASSFAPSRLAVLLAAALPALAAHAADEAPTQAVVVTAARVQQKLPDALPATTVISRHDIETAPATDLPGLLSQLTSLSVAQSGTFAAQTSVFVRGANSGQVLVLVDGAPISRADAGSSPWELLPLGQIDHIEIVRGNLSSLYGSGAVGGVVQVFTKGGDHAGVGITAGSRGRVALDASIGRRFGDADHALEIGGGVTGQVSSGYNATNPATNPGNNPDRDGGSQTGENLHVGKHWARGQRTDLRVIHSDTTSDYDGYGGPEAVDRLKTSLTATALQSRHSLGDSFELGVGLTDTLILFDDPTSFTPHGSARTDVAGADLGWTLSADHALQLGVEQKNERGSSPDLSRRTRSARLGYEGTIASVLDVQANVRHDDPSDFSQATTGLLALGWRLSPAWKLVGQFSTAFSAPDFFAIQSEASAGVADTLKPERSRDLELGVHWQGTGWLARATWFSQRQRDLIDYHLVGESFVAYNVSRATNRGVELAADGDTGHGKLGLDATFQNARNAAGAPLLRRPRTEVAANYRVAFQGWETGAFLHYAGPHHDTDPVTFGTVKSRARTTLGLSAEHALAPNWTVGLKVDNLTNASAPVVVGYTAPKREVLATLRGAW